MPFIHPILFWLGLGGVSIPILIHILNRRRFKIVEWAAMRFLLDAMRKNRRRLRLEEMILLVLRCLILLLLGMALARFVGCSAIETLSVGAGERIAFVLDDSLSMGQSWGDQTAFDVAKEDLVERIQPLMANDQAAIWLTSQPEKPLLPLGEIEDIPALVDRASALKPTALRTQLSDSVQAAAKTLAEAEGHRRCVIFTDARRIDLDDEAESKRLAEVIRTLEDAGVTVTVLDYGREAEQNLTLESLALESRFALTGASVRMAVTVRNNGTKPSAATQVTLTARRNGMAKDREIRLPVVSLPPLQPGELLRRELDYTPEKPGTLAITATLPADALPGDNTTSLILDVKTKLKLLLVDGQRNPDDPESDASYFLSRALDPTGDGTYGFAADVIGPATFSTTNLGDYDAIVLADVKRLGTANADGDTVRYPQVDRLERYVDSGGALLVFTGPNVSSVFYNDALVRAGKGLLPYPLGRAVGDLKQRLRFVRLDPESISETGMMSFFSGDASIATQLIRIYGYLTMDTAGGSENGVIEARYNDPVDTPAVVSKRFGQGTVVCVNTTASLRWNDWAMDAVGDVKGLYVLFLADLIERMARRQDANLNATTGGAIAHRLPSDTREAVARLQGPQAGSELVTLTSETESDGRAWLRFAHPRDAGVYTLTRRNGHATGGKTTLYARNIDPREGQLSPLTPGELTRALGSDSITHLQRGQLDEAPAADDREFWMLLVASVLALLTLESYLAMKFGHWPTGR